MAPDSVEQRGGMVSAGFFEHVIEMFHQVVGFVWRRFEGLEQPLVVVCGYALGTTGR